MNRPGVTESGHCVCVVGATYEPESYSRLKFTILTILVNMNNNQLNLFGEKGLIIPKTYGIKYAGSKLKIIPYIVSLINELKDVQTVLDNFVPGVIDPFINLKWDTPRGELDVMLFLLEIIMTREEFFVWLDECPTHKWEVTTDEYEFVSVNFRVEEDEEEELEEKRWNLMDKYRDVGMSPSDFM